MVDRAGVHSAADRVVERDDVRRTPRAANGPRWSTAPGAMGPVLALQRMAGNAAVAGMLASTAQASNAQQRAEQRAESVPAELSPLHTGADTNPTSPQNDVIGGPAGAPEAHVLDVAEQQAQAIEAAATAATTNLSAAAETEQGRARIAFGAELAAVDARRDTTTARLRADVGAHTQTVAAAAGQARATVRSEAVAGRSRTGLQVNDLSRAASAQADAQLDRARGGARDRIAAMGSPSRSADPDVAAGQERIHSQVRSRAVTDLSASGARAAEQVRARAAERQRRVYEPTATRAQQQISAGAKQAADAIGQGQASATVALRRTASVTERSVEQAHRAVTSALGTGPRRPSRTSTAWPHEARRRSERQRGGWPRPSARTAGAGRRSSWTARRRRSRRGGDRGRGHLASGWRHQGGGDRNRRSPHGSGRRTGRPTRAGGSSRRAPVGRRLQPCDVRRRAGACPGVGRFHHLQRAGGGRSGGRVAAGTGPGRHRPCRGTRARHRRAFRRCGPCRAG